MSNLKERLICFLDSIGMNKSEFERHCGLSNGFVDKSGDNTRRSSLDKISIKFPNLNVNWIITGEGEMTKSIEYASNALSVDSPFMMVPFVPA